MIKNLILDFGDVFINLDKEIVLREIPKWGGAGLTPELRVLNDSYEVGSITSEQFIAGLQKSFPNVSKEALITVWNGMLLDFPENRLQFIEDLAKTGSYRLFLLSNTNALHIAKVQEIMGMPNYNRFKNAFEQFYLSHEIHLRKPDAEIFQFVLSENGLRAEETFFVDDTQENTDAAAQLGIRTWNLQVGQEDIVQLKERLLDV